MQSLVPGARIGRLRVICRLTSARFELSGIAFPGFGRRCQSEAPKHCPGDQSMVPAGRHGESGAERCRPSEPNRTGGNAGEIRVLSTPRSVEDAPSTQTFIGRFNKRRSGRAGSKQCLVMINQPVSW